MKRGKSTNEREADSVSERMCKRLRELRRKNRWTLQDLSLACGVSRSMLSQIERHNANPTLGVAYRIARAFGLSLGDLLDLPKSKPIIDVIRANDRSFEFRNDKDCSIRTLSPLNLEKDVEFYELTLLPGKALRSAPHFEGTREFLTVQSSSVRVTSGNETIELQRGDSAHYPADVVHSIENTGRANAVVFLVDIYRRTDGI